MSVLIHKLSIKPFEMVSVNVLKSKLFAGLNVKVVCCTNGDSSLYDLYNIMTLTQSNLPWPTYLPNNEENRDTIFSFFSQNK